ncbi:MAG TPA: TIGR01440 family protein [Pseudogracilibacillus sp.]|nr:TIGR01440 family protein [Pseudogracilibacillus sp.]
MTTIHKQVKQDMDQLVDEWLKTDYLQSKQVFIIGCSTSEVVGETIGTSGSEAVAEEIFTALNRLKDNSGVALAFQCCEHLNRAIVLERSVQEALGLEPVSAIPHKDAGGSMATYAYKHMKDPVLVEGVSAHAGIDIGNTLIGMHLKKVAVPLRFQQKQIGNAPLTGARTRPKLIGGARARYE